MSNRWLEVTAYSVALLLVLIAWSFVAWLLVYICSTLVDIMRSIVEIAHLS